MKHLAFAFLFLVCGIMLMNCTPKIPAEFDRLPDELMFEYKVGYVKSDLAGTIILHKSRDRINLSDEELEAFQQVMEESDFFKHTTVYRDLHTGVIDLSGLYSYYNRGWNLITGLSNYTSTYVQWQLTPVVFNRQSNALFTNPKDIPFYATLVDDWNQSPETAIIAFADKSTITKAKKQHLREDYKSGRHITNIPYWIPFTRYTFNAPINTAITIEYWKLTDLFVRVYLNEFTLEITDSATGLPVKNPELTIHAFVLGNTQFNRFGFFGESVKESPFSERYKNMYSYADGYDFASHNVTGDVHGKIQLQIPLHPERQTPQMHYSVQATGYEPFTAQTELSEKTIVILMQPVFEGE